MTKKVYDLSKWNIITSYDAIAKEVDGVIIRCGYRGNATGKLTMDPTYIEKITELYKRGVPVGIYFFTTAITEFEAREEAVFAIKLAENLNIDLSFPIMVDSEYAKSDHNGRSDKLSNANRTNILLAFINQCHESGYEAAIYSSDAWFVQKLDYNKLKGIKKWVARYGNKPSRATDTMIGWQKTNESSSAGIRGNVDENEWYADINKAAAKYTAPIVEDVKEVVVELKEGKEIVLKDCPLYSSSASNKVVRKISGKYYIWSAKKILGRVRITNDPKNIGVASKVTGWIKVEDIK